MKSPDPHPLAPLLRARCLDHAPMYDLDQWAAYIQHLSTLGLAESRWCSQCGMKLVASAFGDSVRVHLESPYGEPNPEPMAPCEWANPPLVQIPFTCTSGRVVVGDHWKLFPSLHDAAWNYNVQHTAGQVGFAQLCATAGYLVRPSWHSYGVAFAPTRFVPGDSHDIMVGIAMTCLPATPERPPEGRLPPDSIYVSEGEHAGIFDPDRAEVPLPPDIPTLPLAPGEYVFEWQPTTYRPHNQHPIATLLRKEGSILPKER